MNNKQDVEVLAGVVQRFRDNLKSAVRYARMARSQRGNTGAAIRQVQAAYAMLRKAQQGLTTVKAAG